MVQEQKPQVWYNNSTEPPLGSIRKKSNKLGSSSSLTAMAILQSAKTYPNWTSRGFLDVIKYKTAAYYGDLLDSHAILDDKLCVKCLQIVNV